MRLDVGDGRLVFGFGERGVGRATLVVLTHGRIMPHQWAVGHRV